MMTTSLTVLLSFYLLFFCFIDFGIVYHTHTHTHTHSEGPSFEASMLQASMTSDFIEAYFVRSPEVLFEFVFLCF